jgi:hypothetical protein
MVDEPPFVAVPGAAGWLQIVGIILTSVTMD